MTPSIRLHRNFFVFGIPLAVIISAILLVSSPLFYRNPEALSIGITLDLILTAPILYFFLIRKRSIPNTSVTPLFLAGVVIASLIIPEEYQSYLDQIKKWVIPVVEIVVFSIVAVKVHKTYKRYRSEKQGTPDFLTALTVATQDLVPEILRRPLAMEIAVIYYGLISWKRRRLRSNEFSYHKRSGTVALFSVALLIVTVETGALHLLFQQWSHLAAWILTAISLYSGLQILAFARSLSKRPIAIESDRIELRYGILSETTILFRDIESVDFSSQPIDFNEGTRKLSPLGNLEKHNTVIHLKGENVLFGLYQVKKRYKSLAFHLDDPKSFERELQTALRDWSAEQKGIS